MLDGSFDTKSTGLLYRTTNFLDQTRRIVHPVSNCPMNEISKEEAGIHVRKQEAL